MRIPKKILNERNRRKKYFDYKVFFEIYTFYVNDNVGSAMNGDEKYWSSLGSPAFGCV